MTDATEPPGESDRRDAMYRKLLATAEQLGEHFDAVQVIATETMPEGSIRYRVGVGCIYTRMAVAREWLLEQDESARLRVRKEQEEGED